MQAAQPAQPQHRVENVRGNVHCIFGPGGNVGVIEGEEYLVLVDGQFERSLPGLLEAVKKISNKPIKYLINTHHHGDHVDSNRALASQLQGIIAHVNLRTRMAKAQENAEPDKKGGLPDLLIGEADANKSAMMTLLVGDTEVHAAHFGIAHTDNDVAVGIPSQRVIHLGDMLFLRMLPFIDTESSGNFGGLVQVLGHILRMLPEDALIIPGHGPICDKAELARHHAFLSAVQQHARANSKMEPKELAETFDKEPWKDKVPGFVSWETLFQAATGKGSGRVKN
jgi:glyoxylase-like metal-dependent hydrolase (beta-lactamase superfamily II)